MKIKELSGLAVGHIMAAAVVGGILAVVIDNTCLKVYDMNCSGSELFNTSIEAIPVNVNEGGMATPSAGYSIALSKDGKLR